MIKPQTLKGFRDFLPEEKRKRDYVLKKIVEVFKRFGFEPLETPTLEQASLLLGKYGEEADKLVYSFKDRGYRSVALRYDLTVPVARVLAQYQQQLGKCFRRYQTQNVFRADKPQKGRYREFTQCDIDIFNSTDSLSDAEIIACTYFSFKAVGYPTIVIKINDRQTLFAKLKPFETSKVSVLSIIQSVDKLDKFSAEKVIEELVLKGLQKENAQKAIQKIQSAEKTASLETIIQNAVDLGVPKNSIKFEPCLARGLDYYTGMIFEVIVPNYPVGSLGGGGRYDELIQKLGGVNVPAVGVSFGFDRMVEAADELNLIPQEKSGARILVTVFDKTTQQLSLETAASLRKSGVNTQVYPSIDKLDKQIKYADKKNIPYVAIIGPDEAKSGKVTVKDMENGTQKTIVFDQLIKVIA